MRPVREGQIADEPLGGNGGAFRTKHVDLGAAEAVDGLLGVAHDEEPAPLAVEQLDQVALALVGVLEFVHQQGGRLLAPAGQDVGIAGEQRQRLLLQVVEIQRTGLCLAGSVAGQCGGEDALQLRRQPRCGGRGPAGRTRRHAIATW